MSTQRPHVNDIGTPFRFTCKDEDEVVIELTSATGKVVTFSRPDRTTFDRDLEIVDENLGVAEYVTVEGDLDQDGSWRVQVFIDLPDGEWHSDVERFRVYPNI